MARGRGGPPCRDGIDRRLLGADRHLLGDRFAPLLVNARPIKQVPGRKTDVKGAAWIARLLAHGLLAPGFVPPPEVRAARLTRQRTEPVHDRVAVVDRVPEVPEEADIKPAGAASDGLGVSGRAMIRALIAGREGPVRWPSWRGSGCGARSPG